MEVVEGEHWEREAAEESGDDVESLVETLHSGEDERCANVEDFTHLRYNIVLASLQC